MATIEERMKIVDNLARIKRREEQKKDNMVEKSLKLAISQDDDQLFEMMKPAFDSYDDKDVKFCFLAVSAGKLERLKYLVSKGYALDHFVLFQAIDNNDIPTVHWLIDNDCPIDNYEVLFDAPVVKGHLDLAKIIYFRFKDKINLKQSMLISLGTSHIETSMWIREMIYQQEAHH